MKTVWIENDEPWAAKYSDSEFINYKTKEHIIDKYDSTKNQVQIMDIE